MGENVLVIGAAGFVGQHLVERLVDDGHRVTAMDIQHERGLSFSDEIGDRVDYLRGSVLHRNFIDNVVFTSPNQYDRVYHLAAIVGVDRYVEPDNPLHLVNVNVNGTRHVLERIRGTDTRFVYVSTSEVYGKNPDVPWSETSDQHLGSPTTSRWAYSSMKSVCEQMVHMLDENGEIRGSVVRPFNLYGPYQRPKFVIPKFVEMALDGDPPTVYGDGSQKRCFTYIGDFIDALVAAGQRASDDPRTYNVGGTTETTIAELAREIVDVVGLDRDPEYVDPTEEVGSDYEEPERRIPDIECAETHLGWTPTMSLREGLERTVADKRD